MALQRVAAPGWSIGRSLLKRAVGMFRQSSRISTSRRALPVGHGVPVPFFFRGALPGGRALWFNLDFLYKNLGRGSHITLKPGVAYCLRAFYELLRDLVQGAWVRFVQRLNANRLGSATDLGTFLFGQERASLDVYRPILMVVQPVSLGYSTPPQLFDALLTLVT